MRLGECEVLTASVEAAVVCRGSVGGVGVLSERPCLGRRERGEGLAEAALLQGRGQQCKQGRFSGR